MASNNAMELLAVAEALRMIADQMHVWIMTDSAYVKNGITQWVSNWLKNGWKNASGARVANKSLWERLIAAVNRMRRVEWSWVKAPNGRLLNECADMLATRGVFNEPRPCPVETVRVVGEDSDVTVYELRDGEETPVTGKDGDVYPVGQTYVLKAGPEAPRAFSAYPSSSAESAEQAIEANLCEALDLCTRDVQGTERTAGTTHEVSDHEDEGTFPAPSDEVSGDLGVSTEKIARTLKHMAERLSQEARPKPEW
jgi:ribonuclease HI